MGYNVAFAADFRCYRFALRSRCRHDPALSGLVTPVPCVPTHLRNSAILRDALARARYDEPTVAARLGLPRPATRSASPTVTTPTGPPEDRERGAR
jgi:hypothetical protein